jgi:hypothetical protein
MPTHNPGSIEAIKAGCTCCPDKNHAGAGAPINGGDNHRWQIALYCPLHSSFERPEA